MTAFPTTTSSAGTDDEEPAGINNEKESTETNNKKETGLSSCIEQDSEIKSGFKELNNQSSKNSCYEF